MKYLLVGTSKRKVHRALNAIREYLLRELKLELNGSTQVYRFEYGLGKYDKKDKELTKGRAVNALGAVIHHNRITLRKSILMRMRRKALRIAKKTNRTWHDGASMFARLSWVRFTDTYTYYAKYVKPIINTRQLKDKIRKHNREIMPITEERRRIVYDGLEGSKRLAEREAGRI